METTQPGRNSSPSAEPVYANLDHRLAMISLGLGTLACLTALILGGLDSALSFLVGAALSFLNFSWLKQGVDHLFKSIEPAKPMRKRAVRGAIFKYCLRYVLIGLALYAIVRFRLLEVAGLFSGLFLLVGAILIECVLQVVRGLAEGLRHGAR